MEPVNFKEVAALINLSPITHIDTDSPIADGPAWTLYRAHHSIQRQTYPFDVLTVRADAKADDLRDAHRAISARRGQTDVVYAASLATADGILPELFAEGTRGFDPTPDYFKLFIENDLEKYAASLERAYPAPPHFVPPRIETPSGFAMKSDGVLGFLRSEPGIGEEQGQRLGVVLAEAGQGKTYHSQHLASQLVKDWRTHGKRLPIYIDSRQWSQLSRDDFKRDLSLSKTIFHSFRHFGAPISWAEGHEEDFLSSTLRLGLFTLLFDGFDEYVLWNQYFTAATALGSLIWIARSTTARVVVTCRDSYWSSEVLPVRPKVEKDEVFAYRLLPFDQNHARNYFQMRLRERPVVDAAVGVFQRLATVDDTMAGRGFVLHLIADLFDRGSSGMAPELALQPGQSVMEWLLPALCQREQERHQLPLSAKEQLAAFRELAREAAQGVRIDDDRVSLALRSSSPSVEGFKAHDAIVKLAAHPFIESDVSGESWTFRHEYVQNILVAQYVDELLDGPNANAVADCLARTYTRSPAGVVDLASVLVRVSVGRDATGNRLRRLVTASGRTKLGLALARFVSSLAFGAVDALEARGNPADRMAKLLWLFDAPPGSHRFERFAVSGTVARFDLRGVTFSGCSFEDVTLAKCEVDATTTFDDCRFHGGRDVQSKGFGEARFLPEPQGDESGLRWIRNRQVAAGKRKYTSDDLGDEVATLLRRFIGRGGAPWQAVAEANLRSGGLQDSPHVEVIIEAVKRHVLDVAHRMSGGRPAYGVREEAKEAMRFFNTNNHLSGPLLEAYEEIERKLGLV